MVVKKSGRKPSSTVVASPGTVEQFRVKYDRLFPHLDEKQRRLLVAGDVLSHGLNVSVASRASGLARNTIYRGMHDLQSGQVRDSVRRPGGGRKSKAEELPGLDKALESLVEPVTRGDPMSPLRWTCKSTRNLAVTLTSKGFAVSHRVVADLLHKLGYSLQANAKTIEGTAQHPDRNEQFEYINSKAKSFLRQKMPVISVDTKKKELIGAYKNGGREWRPEGDPEKVCVHDFIDPQTPKAIPYGVYDVGANTGYVNVGKDHDTATFAVASIREWWRRAGQKKYNAATKILICADGGGSNGYRVRLWKIELQKLANETGLEITVCHLPPGTSKWNKIEHRMFCFITINWRGKPLLDYQTIVHLIGSTKNGNGLRITARLDPRKYPKRSVAPEEMKSVNIRTHKFHGDWNYTISPTEK